MAVIGSIRRRSGLMIIIIGLAMLAFILGDFFGSGAYGGPQETQVGRIDDVEIGAQELEQRTQYWSDIYARGYNQQITNDQARNIAWGDLVKEKTTMADIRETGFGFSTEEFDDIRFGEGALEEYTGTYVDENGQFDPDRVKATYSNLYNNQETRFIWEAERRRLETNQLEKKYKSLLSKTMMATSIDAKDAYTSKNGNIDFRVTYKRFNTIADSTISISEDELRAYFNTHKGDKKYEQKAARDMELAIFDVVPTAEDIADTRKEVAEYVTKFEKEENDSLFVTINSDTKSYSVVSYTRSDLGDDMADAVFNAELGQVVGPKEDGDQLTLMKVVGDDVKELATVRHILLNSNEENDTEIKQRADSLKKAIKRGADFEALVEEFTDDPGSKSTGGKYEDFPRGQMVPEFEEFSFDEAIGSVGVVKTTYGYHIIENLDRSSEPQRKVVELVRNIEPSAATFDAVYQEANTLTIDNENLDTFTANAETKGYTLKTAGNVVPSATTVGGVTNVRPIVTWAYETKREVGDISSPMEIGNKFVVAYLTGSREDGAPRFEDVEEDMRVELLKEKKADIIKAEFGEYASLEEAAQNAGTEVQDATGVSISAPNIPGAGREPQVVGAAMAYEPGDILRPMAGNNGVYVIEVSQKSSIDFQSVDTTTEKESLQTQLRNSVNSGMQRAIEAAYGVKNDIARYF